ncbi:MAG: tRNA lysidine(34) synthetase TilS, partial [Aquificota bacterium]
MRLVMGPEAFLERVRKTVEEHRLLERGHRVLVALSGGVDSVVLLHVLLRLAPRYSLGVEAAHFHHGLRGDEADRDQAFVEHLCREWGVRLEVGRGEVAELAKERGRGVEEAAREARYAFLRRVMEERGLSPLAVAHTLSDAVETFFMRLIKGASPYGLRGILPRKGEVVRPLIDVTREEVEEYARIHGLSYVEDSTNRDLARFRNWVRWRLLPLLKEQNPKVERAVGRFMEILREEDSLLREKARSIGLSLSREREGEVELSRSSLAELPKGKRRRVVMELINYLGGDARWTNLENLGYIVEGEGE